MKFLKNLFTALTIVSIAACGNASEQVEETAEEAHDMHHDHDHSGAMPVNPDDIWVPEGARVFFANLNDGDTVSNPVQIKFGVEGMAVVPAGQIVRGTGHHHIIIDGGFVAPGDVVPADENNIHYGGGQSEAEITLSSGEHTLTMQFANGINQSYGEQMSQTIKVFVK